MRHFSVSVDIEAPPARVWDVMSDVERWHEWTPSIDSIRKRDAGPLRVGTRATIRQPRFPPARWRVTEVVPGERFTWINRAPGLRVSGRHSVEPSAGGSRATLALDLEGILGGLFGRLTRGITERYLAYEATGLKARSESPGFRHPRAPR